LGFAIHTFLFAKPTPAAPVDEKKKADEPVANNDDLVANTDYTSPVKEPKVEGTGLVGTPTVVPNSFQILIRLNISKPH
jgi:hypothetical protein